MPEIAFQNFNFWILMDNGTIDIYDHAQIKVIQLSYFNNK